MSTGRQRRAKYAVYCKLTCLGGSEQGMCPCQSPAECEMQSEPGFEEARQAAAGRMLRWVKTKLPPDALEAARRRWVEETQQRIDAAQQLLALGEENAVPTPAGEGPDDG